jgi:tRNA (guanine-N7-)-methyltransferase
VAFWSDEDRGPIALDRLPDWRARLGTPAGVALEIGPGHGGFVLAMAARHPDRAYVAIEQRKKFASELSARAGERGLGNLVAIQGDARLLAPRMFGAGTLDAIHFHFPDPWWKRKHHRRRLLDDPMSQLLYRLLRPGGALDFRTDVERYGRSALTHLEAVGFENVAGPGRFADADPEEVPSTRERRYLAAGEPVWRLRLRRPTR